MREHLKNFDWHLYGLQPGDLAYTFSMVENTINERRELLEHKYNTAQASDKDDV